MTATPGREPKKANGGGLPPGLGQDGREAAAVRWVADQVERWPIHRLTPYARNARVHAKAQISQICASMARWGVTMPILVDEAGEIIAGHGRVLAALELKYDELPVLVARGWSVEDKKAYRIADNRLAELSSWDGELLAMELGELKAMSFDMDLIGWSTKDLGELLTPAGDLVEDANKSALLALVNVTIEEPKRQVEAGDHYVLAGRHHLICASVISGWLQWKPLLTAEALFCPYAGVFMPFSKKASLHPLVMVQPDPYIAGHMLDRFDELNAGTVVKQIKL